MRLPLILLGLSFALAGCSVPKSRDEMLTSAASVHRTCSAEHSPADAAARLRAAWIGCFVTSPGINVVPLGQTVAVSPKSRVIVTSEQAGSTGVLIARLARPPVGVITPLSNSVLLMADIQATAECRSEVIVRAASSHWEKRAKQTTAWLTNPDARPQRLSATVAL